jgi:hypothetical protein
MGHIGQAVIAVVVVASFPSDCGYMIQVAAEQDTEVVPLGGSENTCWCCCTLVVVLEGFEDNYQEEHPIHMVIVQRHELAPALELEPGPELELALGLEPVEQSVPELELLVRAAYSMLRPVAAAESLEQVID